MYLTMEETAEYLQFPVAFIENLIQQGKIRALHDGENYLINKEQFNDHLEQLEKYKKQLAEWQAEPLPEDMDIKDED
ncbi:excisionase family DNA-binding protein [Lederbergia lenta]|uniref:DNA binding domain, excisionase family n=1 Tax=Lederbergia lenta TaxID=1467 RepID=A0A2X4YQP3_LEDLE|nr:excisionase family DNA-binding protein [Lederbergia lenta]MCM3110928.1 excisionase family DNA-binding protein [Lederbergia lenta]MEC2325676.1 excisionase family DNA-binding protein [Lederbergia lenta]SQI53985.1 DNA binding domain, excisionase family [Lederbergia lenta]